ncbi:large-conductance mechanosensitive channel protein MscL [Planktosalinus lacus]|uniref:Large-conductance mechanosensitive channel n=1 Tax=Planktosalinus lacus TaxID=1526573 RepID=A0A8J2Y9V5_9FLAO|nr:large-conductance mechanosensitive channel protein MscL [Planktosalinus lacus]GGD94448.1 large-conductance mechanosensitive channel [Planktosalinus lacus]
MKGFFKEFKEFAVKGNMMDMAIGIIIGASFNAVVNTLVKKVIMPPLTLLTKGINFEDRKVVLREEELGETGKIVDPEVAIGYGEMISVLLDFLIVAFTIYLVVRFLNRLRSRSENPKDKAVETPKNIELLSNIENLLKEQNTLLKNQKRTED